MKAELLINPKAGLLKGCKTATEVRQKLIGLDLEPNVTIATNAQHFQNFIAKVKRTKPQVVLLAGGDGTIASVMKSLLGQDVTFGLIPTGSMNNIGLSLGLNDDLTKSVKIINQAKTIKIDAGKANGVIFLESVGVGLLANIMAKIGEQDSKKEVLKVAKQTLLEMVNSEPIPSHIKTNQTDQVTQTMWLSVTNTGRAAAMIVDEKAKLTNRMLELVYLEPLDRRELPRYIRAYLNQTHLKQEKFHKLNSTHFELQFPPGTELHVDAELFQVERVEIEVIPAAYKVFAP